MENDNKEILKMIKREINNNNLQLRDYLRNIDELKGKYNELKSLKSKNLVSIRNKLLSFLLALGIAGGVGYYAGDYFSRKTSVHPMYRTLTVEYDETGSILNREFTFEDEVILDSKFVTFFGEMMSDFYSSYVSSYTYNISDVMTLENISDYFGLNLNELDIKPVVETYRLWKEEEISNFDDNAKLTIISQESEPELVLSENEYDFKLMLFYILSFMIFISLIFKFKISELDQDFSDYKANIILSKLKKKELEELIDKCTNLINSNEEAKYFFYSMCIKNNFIISDIDFCSEFVSLFEESRKLRKKFNNM